MLANLVLYLYADIIGKDFDNKKLCAKFGVPSLAGKKSLESSSPKYMRDAEIGTSIDAPTKDQAPISRVIPTTTNSEITTIETQSVQKSLSPEAPMPLPSGFWPSELPMSSLIYQGKTPITCVDLSLYGTSTWVLIKSEVWVVSPIPMILNF